MGCLFALERLLERGRLFTMGCLLERGRLFAMVPPFFELGALFLSGAFFLIRQWLLVGLGQKNGAAKRT